jgi:hypothetical protein
MAICLTNTSVRLLGAYFQRKLNTDFESYKEKEFGGIVKALYESALTDFSGKIGDVTTENVSDEEVILQHMTIVPNLLVQYLKDSGKLGEFPTLVGRAGKESSNVFNAFKKGAVPTDYLNLMNLYSKMTTGQPLLATSHSPIIKESHIIPAFVGVNFNFNTTKGQYSVKDTDLGVRSNVEDLKYVYHTNAVRNILRHNNPNRYRFTLTSKDVMAATHGDAFLGGLVEGKKAPVLVITDENNNPIKFNDVGIEDPNGFIPAFELIRLASQMGVVASENADGVVTVSRVYYKPKAFDTYRTPVNYKINHLVQSEGLTQEQAERAVFLEVGTYLTNVKRAIKRSATEEVTLPFDLVGSSYGVLEENDMSITNLLDIKNLSDGFVLATDNNYGSTQSMLHIPNSNKAVHLQRQSLDSLPQDKLNVILELLTNNDLLNENKTKLTRKERTELLSAYLELSDKAYVRIGLVWGKGAEKNEIVGVELGTTRYTISPSRVKGPELETNKIAFNEAFNNFITEFHSIDYQGVTPFNYPMVSDVSQVITHNQVYEPVEGKLMKAMRVPISANLGSNPSSLNYTFNRPVKIVDGVVVTESVTFEQHLMETSYTRVIPNVKGEIKTVSPYIAFHLGSEANALQDAPTTATRFMSVEANNKSTEKLVRGEEEWATEWLGTLGLENSKLKVILSDKVHKYGPNYLASFFVDSISLFGGSNKTALYHEVFHAYADGIMTPAEKMAMLQEVKKAFAGQTLDVTVAGKKKSVNVDSLNLNKEEDQLAVEEWLAEQFRAFARNESYLKNKDLPKTKSFFKRLLDFLKKLIGLNTTYAEATVLATQSEKIHTIFNDLYDGNIDFSKFQPVQMESEKFQSLEVANDIDMSEQDMYTTMSTMRALFHNFIQTTVNPSSSLERNIELSDLLLQMSTLNENTPEYKVLDDRYVSLVNESRGTERGGGMYIMQNNPELVVNAMKWMLNKIEDYAEKSPNEDATKLFDKIKLYYGGVQTTRDSELNIISQTPKDIFKNSEGEELSAGMVIANLIDRDSSLLAVFYNMYTTLNVVESTFKDDKLEAQKREAAENMWDRAGNEFNIADTVDQYTREILETLYVYKNQGQSPTNEVNLLGIPKLMPFERAMKRVLVATEGSKSRIHMYDLLRKAAYKIDTFTGKEVVKDHTLHNLLYRLGNPSRGLNNMEQTQWNRLYLSLGKPTIRLRTLELEKIDNDETKTSTITARSGKNKLSQVQVKGAWKMDFLHMGENVFDDTSMFKDGGENGRVLDLEKLLKKYKAKGNTKALWKEDPAAFLRELGINVPSTEEVTKMLSKGSSEYGIDPNFVYDLINNLEKRLEIEQDDNMSIAKGPVLNRLESIFSEFSYTIKRANNTVDTKSERGLQGYLNNLADFSASHNDEYITYMSYTPSGEAQSEKSFHSSVTVQLMYLNDAVHIDEVISTPGLEHYNYKINPILAGNMGFVQMFQLNHEDVTKRGERNPNITMYFENNVGTKIKYKNQEAGVKSIKSDPRTKFSTEFHQILGGGRQEILRTEAKSISYSWYIPITKKGERGKLRHNLYLNDEEIHTVWENMEYANLKGDKGLLLFEQFSGYIEAELIRINRINDFEKNVLGKLEEDETVEFDVNLLNRGKEFIIFDLILSETTQKELKKLNVNESFTLRERLDEKPALLAKIELELMEYFEDRAIKLMETYDNDLVIADELIDQFRDNEEEGEPTIRARMYRAVSTNSFIQYLSFQSVFLGDPSNYDIHGEGFHKRIAGATSTGTIMVDDAAWHDYVNGEEFNHHAFAKKHMENLSPERKAELESLGKTAEYKKRMYKGYLETAVIAEAKSTSHLLPHYADVIGVANSGPYVDMEEADGAAWVSFDTYRVLARASDENVTW